MGLKEKRILAEIRDEKIPTYERTLQEEHGVAATFAVNWDEWESDYAGTLHLDQGILFPVVSGIGRVARDTLGREALAEQIQRIVVGRKENLDEFGLTLGAGSLTVAPAIVVTDEAFNKVDHNGLFEMTQVERLLTEQL